MRKAGGGLSELEKLLAASAKRKDRIKAADEALAAPAPAPEPALPPARTEDPTEAASITAAAAAASSISEDPALAEHPKCVPPIFSLPPRPFTIVPLTEVSAERCDEKDPMAEMLAGLDAEEPTARELLCGGWVRAHYERRACPSAVRRWLFDVVCHHCKADVASAASRTLAFLLGASSGDEASGDEASAVWVPLPRDFLDVLQRHGAKLSELGASRKDDAMEREEERGEADAPSTAAHVAGDPRQNLLAALELLPSCARRWSSRLAVSERVAAVRWMLRLTLDLHAAAAFVHLQEAIAAIIDGASDADWSGELLPSLIGALRTLLEPLPHTAVVRAVEFLPPTLRAATLQRLGAAAAIRLLVRRRARQAKAERARDRAEKRRMRTERQEQRKRQKVEAFASGGAVDADDDEEEEEDDDDEHEEEEEEESTGGDGDEDTDEIGIDNAAGALKHALETLDANLYKGRMDALHSILVLTNVCLSAEPSKMRRDATALRAIKSRLSVIKNKAQRNRGVVDYHGLECESLASYLANKLEHLFLADDGV